MVRWKKSKDKDDEDEWRRRFFDPWDDFFDFDIEKEFRRMEEWMNSIIRNFQGKGEIRGPYVYGFTMRMGPDGKPRIEEFGNVPRGTRGIEEIGEYREPLVDVMENDKTISVTAELPGVTKDDIDLNLIDDNQTLIIKVDTPDRKYYKEVQLPAKVKPNKVKATYKNGILDVTFEREKPVEKKGKKIKIE